MTMPSDISSQVFARTLSLIQHCERDLERLHRMRADYRDSIEASRKLIVSFREAKGQSEVQIGPAPAPPEPFSRPPSQFFLERAEETRSFAENVEDPLVKRLLLDIASSYGQAAK